MESKVFEINVDGISIKVEFRLKLVPNDMKMCFISGELSNAAFYFSSFSSQMKTVMIFHVDLMANIKKIGNHFHTKKDVQHVEKKKQQLAQKGLKKETIQNHITSFIRNLESRQEFVPPFGNYINTGKAEPLHLKNNVCKEMFFKILQVVMLMADIDHKVKSFHHISADIIFPVFVDSVKILMKCRKLSKKLIEWFNCEGRDAVFSFRFHGKESGKYLKHFPQMIAMLLKDTNVLSHHERLLQIFLSIFAFEEVSLVFS